jgi:hypothetical protein
MADKMIHDFYGSAAATVHLAIPSIKEAMPFDLCICAYEVLGAIVRCTSGVPPRASCYRVRIRHTLHG